MTRTKVFVSYAHADDRWRKKLVLQLGVLAREDIIEIWDDQQLMAGQAWRSELQSQMSQARIAVLLVSASFLTSEFIRNKEVPKIFQQHEQDGLKIYPLLIGACAWQEVSWLSHLQLRPPGAQPIAQLSAARADGVLADVAREVAAIAREDSPLRRGGATFKKNEFYTRKEINAHLGGSVQSYLPHVSGRVVAACLRVDTNPDAPDVILAGTGEGIERAAAMLIAQNTPVPTFIKRGVGNWEYIGEYTAERSSQDAAELHKWSRRSGRKDITRVIFMLPARPN